MYWQDAITTTLRPLVTGSSVGLITDVDGTISPVVAQPDAAQVTPQNRRLLEKLKTSLALVAVISGRAAADVAARVAIPGLTYIGNHGLEQWQDGRAVLLPTVERFRPALEAALRDVQSHLAPGMFLEDKGATLSIHYRQTAAPAATAATYRPIIEKTAARYGLRFFQGRMVFELRPPVDADKGSAFGNLIAQHQLDAAVYLGDDTTDAAALHAARQLRREGSCYALGIAVLSEGTPEVVVEEADLFAAGVAGVESFLSWLAEACNASSSCV